MLQARDHQSLVDGAPVPQPHQAVNAPVSPLGATAGRRGRGVLRSAGLGRLSPPRLLAPSRPLPSPATLLRPLGEHLHTRATEMFALDLRSLAALRIGLALLILVDLYRRSWDLTAHYTDAGVLPREAFANSPVAQRLSLHLLFGSWEAQAALFAIAALLASLMLVGYRTRWATALSLGLLLSLQYRNPLILSGADVLFRIILFWAIFLPCGAKWSLDSVLRKPRSAMPLTVANIVTAAYVLQIVMMYGFAVLLKSGSDWRADGTAIYYALSLAQFSTPLGQLLVRYPDALNLLTRSVFWWEAIGPLLLLAPFWTARVRLVAILGFAALQAGFGLTLANLGLFPWISSAIMLGLLPSACWDQPSARRVQRWAAARLDAIACQRPLQQLRSAIGSNTLFRGRPARTSQGIAQAVGVGSTERFWEPGPAMRLTVVCCLAYVVLENVSSLPEFPYQVPRALTGAGAPIGLNQKWGMFAPSVPRGSTWYVVPGTLYNGQQVDVYRDGAPVTLARPERGVAVYPNDHWFKYFEALATANAWADRRPFYGAYACRQWNGAHSGLQRLEDLEVVVVRDSTRLDGLSSPVRRETLLTYHCDG
jgi:hypothetical protein